MLVCQTCKRLCDTGTTVCPVDGGAVSAVGGEDPAGTTLPSLGSAATSGSLAQDLLPVLRDADLPPGTMVGEFAVEAQIGEGGMGVVYAARHPVIGKRAAVKVISASYSADQVAVERFVLEAQAVNKIGHANIVDVFSFGQLPDGRSYLVMELLHGETLAKRLARGDLTMTRRLDVLEEVAQALEAAHAAGVIHRDLKPDNVFLMDTADGEIQVKLLDFGVAKLSAAIRPSSTRTQTGVVVGTPLYMSPEQARGAAVDHRTDLYAFGVVAFEMMLGRLPFQDGSPVEILAAHISEPPPTPRSLSPDFPRSLESLLLELLAKPPDDRPGLSEIRRRLAAIRAVATDDAAWTPIGARSGAWLASGTRTRRRWIGAGAAAALAIAAAIVAISIASGEDPAPPPPVEAPPVEVVAAPVAPAPVPAPPPRDGRLELVVEPVTARVKIDGTRARGRRGRVELALAPGDHELVVSARGRLTVRREITIPPGELVTLAITLPPRRRDDPTAVGDGVLDPF